MKKQILLISLMTIALFSCNAQTKNADKKQLKALEIIEKINKGEHVYYQNATIDGDLDFTKVKNAYHENVGMLKVAVNPSITFINCIFNGNVIAYSNVTAKDAYSLYFDKNLTFSKCTFMNEVNFNEAIINGMINFSGSVFEKKSSFDGMQCRNKVNYFSEAKFKDATQFQGIIVSGEMYFVKTEFFGNAAFQQSKFNGDAQFANTKFYGYADFSNCQFVNNCLFNYAEFQKANFGNSIFNQSVNFMNVIFSNFCNFNNAYFGSDIKFNESTFKLF